MKNSKAIFKKAIVGVLSLAMLLTSLLTAIPASAQSAFADEDGFYIPYANTDFVTHLTDEQKPSVNTAFNENGDRAGVRLSFNGGDFTKRVVSTVTYNIDDIALRFNNLKKAEGHEDEVLKFSVMFGSNWDGMPEFRLLFDTEAGAMYYFSGTVAPQFMMQDDLLKYDSLSANEFVVSFDITTTDIVCRVKVGDNEAVEGFINDTNYTQHIPANIASYIVLGPGRDGDYYFSLDVTGIKADDYVRPTNAVLVGGITNLNFQGTDIAIENYMAKFPQARKLSFTTTNDIGNRATSAITFAMDGLSVRFDSLTSTGTAYPEFTFALANNANDLPRIRVAIDTVTGNVKYWRGGEASIPVLAQSDLLKYENLSNSEFTYTFNLFKDENDVLQCRVTIKVNGIDAVVGILPNSYLTNDYKDISLDSQMYLCFGSGTAKDRDPFSVRFTGYRQTKELSFVDGDKVDTTLVNAGQTGIVTPEIELGEGECHAYWMSGATKYTAGSNAVVFTANADTTFTAVRREYGDINDNGEVDGDDLIMLQKYLLGLEDSYLMQAANLNDDDTVTLLDFIRFKKHLVGADVVLGPAR